MAATNINRVVLTGNLTRDPELRSTPSGTPVCSLRIVETLSMRWGAEASTTRVWADVPTFARI